MSRSKDGKNGEQTGDGKKYFAWKVARIVLCRMLNSDWEISDDLSNESFQDKFYNLDINRQILVAELLIEIADSIQFWTMRLDETVLRDDG